MATSAEQRLVPYGIAEEESDLRAHVSFFGGHVIVFRTVDMLDLIKLKRYPVRHATQEGVEFVTGSGYVVPFNELKNHRQVTFRKSDYPDTDNLKELGQYAELVVCRLLQQDRFPLFPEFRKATKQEDLSGSDFIVSARSRRIQVKCDNRACSRAAGGTGNLFIQIAELNPNKIHVQ